MRRSDVAIFLVATALLLGNLAAIGTAGRERAKRAVCLSNLKRLTGAWEAFADDHDGQLVNGAAGIGRLNADPWVGRCWASDYFSGGQLSKSRQRTGIREGALWAYLEELKLYRCPSGYAGEMVTYAIVDSMFGMGRTGTVSAGGGVRVDDTVTWIRKIDEVIAPGPAERMVFIDEGWVPIDSFAVLYKQEAWWEGPPVQHNDGTTVTFADGHGEYWQWGTEETIEAGRAKTLHRASWLRPETTEGREDLHRLQRAVWGRLGYEPTQP